jgi:hypothetical protein
MNGMRDEREKGRNEDKKASEEKEAAVNPIWRLTI